MKSCIFVLIGALMLFVPAAGFCAPLTVSASITGGYALGDHVLLSCAGYSYNSAGDPWAQCQNLGAGTAMSFGPLTSRLLDAGGGDAGGAGCFYASTFFIVYLFPDAWGGSGYQITQTTTADPAISSALVFTPVYAQEDSYGAGQAAQGALTGDEAAANPQIGVTRLATEGGLILQARRPRIVRAEFGIPPFPGAGDTRPANWQAIPVETQNGTYSATITISAAPY
ncbi:MAG: hypothetical protein PHR11_01930 [Candidatus Omnitrophica bacterium]|nr:hypothetical protein [Candidatus Omnitrophota bacterium]